MRASRSRPPFRYRLPCICGNGELAKLVAFLSKQAQLQELVACIRHFRVDYLRLHLFASQGQLVPDEAQLLLSEVCPSVQLSLSTFNINDRGDIGNRLAEDADIIAMPLYHSSTFYLSIPLLRRKRTIVHLTDGLGDQFTKWELQRAVLAKSPYDLAKGALVVSLLKFCRADVEFSLFHPYVSPYAERSFSVGPFPITEAKRRLLSNLLRREKPSALVIEGFGLDADQIAAEVKVASYVATKRAGSIGISGRIYLPEQVVCAEEILEIIRPIVVIGCPSTALVAARLIHDDIMVMCVTTPEATKIRGARFNSVFRKYARHYGVTMFESNDVELQFAALRQQLTLRRIIQ